MELTESIESINRQLIDLYGIDTITGMAMWRIVWSDDQFEHRRGTFEDFTESGIYLRTVTEVRYVPRYPYIKGKYVLERLVLIPEINEAELPATKLSYEPMYPFKSKEGKYAPPKLFVAQFIIDSVLAAQGKSSLSKYKDRDPMDGLSTEEYLEMKSKEIDILQEELFGNETDTSDALAHGEAIIVPSSYKERN